MMLTQRGIQKLAVWDDYQNINGVTTRGERGANNSENWGDVIYGGSPVLSTLHGEMILQEQSYGLFEWKRLLQI